MFFTSPNVFVFRKIPRNYFVAVFLIEFRFQVTKTLTLLIEDAQVTVSDSEDALQIFIHNLETVDAGCGLKISTRKTETVALKGSDSVRSKIVINNNNNYYVDIDASKKWQTQAGLFAETKGFLTAIHDQVIVTRNCKKYILEQPDTDELCRRYGKESETIQHITAACGQLAPTEYVKRHDGLAKIIFRN